MKILIINLTRMGDLIQTTGLINGLKKQYPTANIDLLVMDVFSPITNHFDNLSCVYSLNSEILNENLKDNVWDAYEELFKVVETLNKNEYDILLNPIVSKQSAILSYLIKSKQKYGLLLTENREQKITSDYVAYHLANQHQLGDHCFNLVDIFAGINEIKIDFSDFYIKCKEISEDTASLRKLNNFLSRHSSHKKVLGVHVGASQSNKAWDVRYYLEVIKNLLKNEDIIIILFGGYKETDYKHFFNEIEDSNFINTIGDFKLDELIYAINKIDLMLTNDTGPMHIATALKKSIIDISLGPVSKWETGAYSQDVLIVEADLECHPCSFTFNCPHWNCHHSITPEIIVIAVMYKMALLNKENADKYFYQLQNYQNVRFYFSDKDIFGYQTFYPLFKYKLSEKEYLFEVKRFIWALVLKEKESLNGIDFKKLFSEYSANLFKYYHLKEYDFNDFKEYLKTMSISIYKIISNLEKINNKKSLDNIKEILLYVKRDKDLLFSTARECDLIYDWFWFTTFKESEIEDENISDIALKTKHIYNKLLLQLHYLSELLSLK